MQGTGRFGLRSVSLTERPDILDLGQPRKRSTSDGRQNSLNFEPRTVGDLIKQTIATGNIQDPFYVVDVKDIIDKHKQWLTLLPRVKPFYAVKCNNSPIVLEIFAALGVGFDCASKTEIESVIECGVATSSIIYANPCKSNAYIEYAENVGVDLMTFDNEEELYKLVELFPKARLVLRIRVDDSHSKYHLGLKFGCDMDEAYDLLTQAYNLGLNVVGVSFHVGSGCHSEVAYKDAISNARQIFDWAEELGFDDMSLLDIGGGFPGNSDEGDKTLFMQIARVVNESLDLLFPPESNVTVIAEPGRYYVSSAFTLTAMIIAKRKAKAADGSQIIMYYINDGVYCSFSNTTFDEDEVEPIPLLDPEDMQQRPVYSSILWGPTCDSLDCLRKNNLLLPEMKIGEWMSFKDMGAYTLAIATRFNGFQMPLMKYHATHETVESLRNLSSWSRFASLMGINKDATSKHIADNIWDFIHAL